MIKILKLITGEEMVGDITDGSAQVTIKQPCVLQYVPSRANPDQPMMALVPYAAYTKDHSITVAAENIIWSETPVDDLYNQYNRIFGSGIQLPT